MNIFSEVLRSIKEISEHSRELTLNVLEKFLTENWNINERELTDDKEQIQEFLVQKNYFSKKDIQFCLQFDLDRLQGKDHFTEKKSPFDALREIYEDL